MTFAANEARATAAGEMVEVYERRAEICWDNPDLVAITVHAADPDHAEMTTALGTLPGVEWNKWQGAWLGPLTKDMAEFIAFYELRASLKLRRQVRVLLDDDEAYHVMPGDGYVILQAEDFAALRDLPGYRMEEGERRADLSQALLDLSHAYGLSVHPDVVTEIVTEAPGALAYRALLAAVSGCHSAAELPAEFVTMVQVAQS